MSGRPSGKATISSGRVSRSYVMFNTSYNETIISYVDPNKSCVGAQMTSFHNKFDFIGFGRV